MKRRNAETTKQRRPVKRTAKISDGMYGNPVSYAKLLAVWLIILVLNFAAEFRFEYFWPLWLFIQSVYDTFLASHQQQQGGVAMGVFFVCAVASSDVLCYLLVPAHWLIVLASASVWLHGCWQTVAANAVSEQQRTAAAICLPTVGLCLLLVIIDAAVMRLREMRHFDICRPLAAHCLGYPMVTLGFGLKSYMVYRMRLRWQAKVAQQNEFYMQLLRQALPPKPEALVEVETAANAVQANGHVPAQIISSGSGKSKLPNGVHKPNGVTLRNSVNEIEFIERVSASDETSQIDCDKSSTNISSNNKNISNRCRERKPSKNGGEIFMNNNISTNPCQRNNNSMKTLKSVVKEESKTATDELLQRLETDVRRMRSELQQSRQSESELRGQLSAATQGERTARFELQQMQSQHQQLMQQHKQDKQHLQAIEKKFRAAKEEANARRATSNPPPAPVAAPSLITSTECSSDFCRQRRREQDSQVQQLRREAKSREEQLCSAEQELLVVRQKLTNADFLLKTLVTFQERNAMLENSLKAETRIKLDLFSALGEAKRMLEIKENVIRSNEKEIEELKGKMAQALAIMPEEPFCYSSQCLSPALSSISHGGVSLNNNTTTLTKLRFSAVDVAQLRCISNEDAFGMTHLLDDSPMSSSSSATALDPNATVYTPRTFIQNATMVTSTAEA